MPLDGLPWAKPSSQALCCGSELWPWTLSIARAVCWKDSKINHFVDLDWIKFTIALVFKLPLNVFALHLH